MRKLILIFTMLLTTSAFAIDLDTLVKVAYEECSICTPLETKAIIDATHNYATKLKHKQTVKSTLTKKAFPWYRGNFYLKHSDTVDRIKKIVYSMDWIGKSNGANHFHLKKKKIRSLTPTKNMRVTMIAQYHVFKKESNS